MITTYDEYLSLYCIGREPDIDAASFPYYERQAEQYINRATFSNIAHLDIIPDEIKCCICEIAESFFNEKQTINEHNGISSEKVGNWSVSYSTKSEIIQENKKERREIIYKWLADTGLLFGGV